MRTLAIGPGLVAIDHDSPTLVGRALAAFTGGDAGQFRISHLCRTCGSTDHGRPAIEGRADVSISISRAGGWQAIAVSDGAGIGVDIESIDRAGAHPVDDVLLHPLERPALDRMDALARRRALAELWAAKEAVLKASGYGLALDPSGIHLERHDDEFHIVSMPSELRDLASTITPFETGVADLVGVVAVSASAAR